MDLTSDETGHIKRRMREQLVPGLELSTLETIEPSSAPKQASPPLTLAALAAYYESD
jgi:hypothetical protein